MYSRFYTVALIALAVVGTFFASTTMVFAATPLASAKPVVAAKPSAAKDLTLWRWAVGTKVPVQDRAFAPFPEKRGAGSVAVADLGTDGVSEVVVGSGFGVPPNVRVLRADGSEIFSFAPFEATMLQGVTVAVGDLDGDGLSEVVVGTGPGADARVRVFDATGKEKLFVDGFAPFGDDFRGGVNLAVADVDGDGKGDIIAAAGPTGGPHVKLWRGDGALIGDFFAFDNKESGGLNIAAGDLDGDGRAEIVTALGRDALSYVRVFSGSKDAPEFKKSGEFLAIGGGFKGGLNLAVGDVDGDGTNEVAVAPNGGGGPHVHVFSGAGAIKTHFFSYEESYRGGVLLAVGRFGGTDGARLVTVPAERTMDGRPHLEKYVSVDVSEQRLRMFEYGKLVKTVLVATGMTSSPTPTGDFSVLAKPLMVNYKWSYGPNHPENYDLGWVKWNLRFYPHIYIHNAPWRKVFGARGSHGCVNVSEKDAEWIYNWATVGTPVTVQD